MYQCITVFVLFPENVVEEVCLSEDTQKIQEFTAINNFPGAQEQVWNALWQRVGASSLDTSYRQVRLDEKEAELANNFSDRTAAITGPVSLRQWRPLHTVRRLWSTLSSSTTATTTATTTYTHNPCAETSLTTYLNRKDVQQAMNVIRKGSSLSVSFAACSSQISSLYSINDVLADVTKLFTQIVTHRNKPAGLQILVLSGDSDLVSNSF